MRRFFLLAASLLALASCNDEEVIQDEPKEYKISVLPQSKEFDNNGGTVSVMVTSTGEWTLSTKESTVYDWVTTDKTSGVDGDMIKFTVDPNETEDTRFAYYVFTSGTATSEFKITSFAGEIKEPLITVDETEIIKDYNKGKFEVIVKYSEGVDYRDLKATIPEDIDWLKYVVTIEGGEDGTAKMQFEYEQLDELDAREVAFTINYDAVSVPMKFAQTPKNVIRPESSLYNLRPAAGTLSIKVDANVDYDVEVVSEDGNWLTDYALSDGTNSWKYSDFEGTRMAIVKFTESAPAEGAEPIVVEVKVVQSNAYITTVARFNDFRAVFVPNAVNIDIFKLGKNMTIELLLKADEDSFNSVSSIIGLERRFLIRHSDSGNQGKWEVVYAKESTWQGEHDEVKVQGSWLYADNWIHIAVTVDANSNRITLYQDGFQVASKPLAFNMKEINLTEKYTNTNNMEQQFAIGYSYNNDRFFNGQISEVRIWNRALTSAEISAKDHFYVVDPDSEGLVAYWKMNEGEGSIIKDHTSNSNDLVGQTYNGTWNDTNIKWEGVTLPE